MRMPTIAEVSGGGRNKKSVANQNQNTCRVFPVEAKHLKHLYQCSLKVRAYLAQA